LPSIDTLVQRLPRHELGIRQLYDRDSKFREVCDDYEEVKHALEYWQASGHAVPGRTAEYRQMLKELEAEALEMLKARERT